MSFPGPAQLVVCMHAVRIKRPYKASHGPGKEAKTVNRNNNRDRVLRRMMRYEPARKREISHPLEAFLSQLSLCGTSATLGLSKPELATSQVPISRTQEVEGG